MNSLCLRVAVLGCGAVAHRWYLPGLSRPDASYELHAVADIDRKRAEAAAAHYGARRVYASLDEVLSDDDVDIVVVLTRHRDHYDHVAASLEAGKHVYAEKPLAPSGPLVRQLVELARTRGVKLGAAPQVMLSARNRRVAELLAANVIGRPTLVRVTSSGFGPGDRPDVDYDPIWFYQDGGSLVSLGIYGLGTLLWLLGVPRTVSCFQGIAIPSRVVQTGPAAGTAYTVTAPDNVAALLEFGDGCLALFDGSYSVANSPRFELEFQGTRGTIWIGGFGGPDSVLVQGIREPVRAAGPEDDPAHPWTLAWGVHDLVTALVEGREQAVGTRLAVALADTMDAMRASAERGRHVAVGAGR
jgi:predicted dehydrogenase